MDGSIAYNSLIDATLYRLYNLNNMKQNKIYQQCREEAKKIIRDKYLLKFNTQYVGLYQDEINQLTAELYAQKILGMAAKVFLPTIASGEVKYWQKDYYQNKDYFYSTKEVHDYFVEENKGGGNA